MKSNYLGGVNALNWRKRVAALADKHNGNAHNRTFKFPLEINEDISRVLPQAEELYNIIEKTDTGSLAGLVFAIHLSGFRLFGAKNETGIFETQGQFPDAEFIKIASATFQNIPNALLHPSKIYKILTKVPRGDKAQWEQQQIIDRLKKELNIKDENVDQKLLDVVNSVGHTIHQEKTYDSWGDVKNNPQVAFQIFASAFKKTNSAFPKFPTSIPTIKSDRIFSYDQKMTFYEMKEKDADYWIHHCVSVIAQSISKEKTDQSPTTKDIQTRLTTESHNALSWLFGKGLDWLQSASLEEVCEELGVPDNERQRALQLQLFAKALPSKDPLWQRAGFSDFRKKVGGKLNSWISNYWKRLDDLCNFMESDDEITIPADLLEERHNHLFSGNNLSAPDLKDAVEKILPQKRDAARESVRTLQGKSDCDVNIIQAVKDVDEVTEYLGSLLGEIEILNNRIENKEDQRGIPDLTQQREQLKIDTKTIKKPDRLNRIGGGVICASAVIEEIEQSLTGLLKARRECYQNLMAHAADRGNTDPMDNIITSEYKKLQDKGKDTGKAEENSRRWVLHQFAFLANRMSEETRENLIEIVKSAFPEKYGEGRKKGRKNRDANKFFYNRQGAIYISPFTTRWHDPLSLADAALTQDWLAQAESLLDSVNKKLPISGAPGLLKDSLILESYIFAMRLRCIPESIPCNLIETTLEMHENKKMFIPAILRAQFTDQDDVPRDAVLKLFNLYDSAINGLLFRSVRSGFITRVVFSREGTDKLIYTPKPNSEWIPPKPYHKGQSPVANALKKDWIVWKEKNRIVDVEQTFEKLCSTNRFTNTTEEVAAYLAQAPHDWCLSLDIEGIGEKRRGITVGTSGNGKFIKAGREHAGLVRLRGPSSRRTMLDRTLRMHVCGNKLQLGDPNLIIDTQYSQTVGLDGDSPCIQIQQESTKMESAILLVDKTVSSEPFDINNRIVAIDLGERGIGYAVFDLHEYLDAEKDEPLPMMDSQGQPVAGTVSVPSIRALIRAVRKYRGRNQPRQKVNLNYSTLLQQRRGNVVGDICNRIDTLCEKYGGFPVLESTVGNLESGARQLELVYNSVTKMYLYDKSKERSTKRQHRWTCANQWIHPWLIKSKYDDERKKWMNQEGDGPYTLYPGASVAQAGTSQTCHRCKRNPIGAIKALEGSHIDVKEGGLIQLPNGHKIKLCDASDPPAGEKMEGWNKRMSREKKRLPLNRPITAKRYKKDEIIRCLKKNFRGPNPSLQSPDTKQSRYHCVYTDCNFNGHADVNAAINIGGKFLKDRVWRAGSIEARKNRLQSLSK